MNRLVADEMPTELIGKIIGGWLVQKYISRGKSAAVFIAERSNKTGALKVFFPEIVERYGREAQWKRIERQLSLVGKLHPNLVEIYDGGQDGDFLYVAMEYFPGRNLAEGLPDIPASEVRSLISQLASAAKFLEDLSFAHRDIKPENIGMSTDMKSVKLLDLGVIRPLDLSNITDEGEQRYFVGTLQYSPPELLFREEEQSIEGWRAVTFYQLGGVLHDLLVRTPLFEDYRNPYAKLVRAVEREVPQVSAPQADADLRLLAQNCLAKVPRQRLDTVKWEDFSRPRVTDPLETARRTIAQHRVASAQVPEPSSPEDSLASQCFALRTAIHSSLLNTIKTEGGGLPRYSRQDSEKSNVYVIRVLFEPSAKHGLGHFFCFYCQGRVIDPRTASAELLTWGCISSVRELLPVEPDPNAQHYMVRGALIEQDIRTHIQRGLLLSYAEALDSKAESEQVTWLILGNAI